MTTVERTERLERLVRTAQELNWDLVWKKNSIERLKKEKFPLDILDELPDLIQQGYEEISEEDIVRFQWYGLYHDRPKIGYFMMRIKIPGGILTPLQLRTIGELSVKYGRNFGELTTRQNVQLHWIQLAHLPDILKTLDSIGLTLKGGCGDTVRNITGSPLAGLDPNELFDVRPILQQAARFFYGNREYSNLPRKHKITISAAPDQGNAPEINCIALVGAIKDGREGFGIRIGGGLSTVPRISDDMGVFVEKDEALTVLRAIIDVWKEDLNYRLSRVKARLKFMVKDIGPQAYRERVEAKLGRKLEDFTIPPPVGETETVGVHPQKQKNRYYIGFPVFAGLMSGEQMIRIADLVETYKGGDIRLTRFQNFILTGVPKTKVDKVVKAVEEIGFPLNVNGIRVKSIACTGQPLCNYAVAETKPKLIEIVQHLEAKFGEQVKDLQIALDGCPHACAHHWVGDIGLQGTTLRERGGDGSKVEAYEIYLRGGLGREAAIGRPIIRRVPADVAPLYVERLVGAYLSGRQNGERIQQFFNRHTDEELIAIANGSEAVPTAEGTAVGAWQHPHFHKENG